MLQVQAQGPYLLGGHSYGGAVAMEIALVLQEWGHDVGLVVVSTALSTVCNVLSTVITVQSTVSTVLSTVSTPLSTVSLIVCMPGACHCCGCFVGCVAVL
jgi:pimeloyl-ACP methyl ester carboxylesterase